MKHFAMIALALFASTAALEAQDKGTWFVKIGAHSVDPKSDNGDLAGGALAATLDSNIRPSIMVEYFVAPNVGVEVLAAWPFSHDVQLNGLEAGSVDHLPPTISLQYHFNNGGSVSPYLGVGVNYTLFFSEETTGPLAGTDLSLDPSFGLAAHVGLDFALGERWSLGIDGRWIDIDSDVEVNGASVGTVEIDPLAYGLYAQLTF
jgi:outer membrane protein